MEANEFQDVGRSLDGMDMPASGQVGEREGLHLDRDVGSWPEFLRDRLVEFLEIGIAAPQGELHGLRRAFSGAEDGEDGPSTIAAFSFSWHSLSTSKNLGSHTDPFWM
jgi:hypothetical protein